MQKKTAYKLMLIKELREKDIIDFGIQNKIYNILNIFNNLYNYVITNLHLNNI